jgi:hypothetical protein
MEGICTFIFSSTVVHILIAIKLYFMEQLYTSWTTDMVSVARKLRAIKEKAPRPMSQAYNEVWSKKD